MNEGFLGVDPAAYGLSTWLSDRIVRLDRVLGRVLTAQEGAWLPAMSKSLYTRSTESLDVLSEEFPGLTDPARLRLLAKAFTLFFQLVNAAEQAEIVRVNRSRTLAGSRRESVDDTLRQLAESNSVEDILEAVKSLRIEPTLTAHPTEAKRRAVHDKLQAVSGLLLQAEGSVNLDLPLDAEGEVESQLEQTIINLWQTDEMRAARITPEEEVRNAIYFFSRSILRVVPWLQRDLRRGLDKLTGGVSYELPPVLRFRSWVGGDRDGNPNVTMAVTQMTFQQNAEMALRHYQAEVKLLRRQLTQSLKLVEVSPEMAVLVTEMSALLQPYQLHRHGREPYVLVLLGLDRLLENTITGDTPCLASADDLLAKLELIRSSLRWHNAAQIADEGELAELSDSVRAFGFHLATLDIRQHSDVHAEVVTEMLRVAGVEDDYGALDEDARIAVLVRELTNPRPLLPRFYGGSPRLHDMLGTLTIVREAQKKHGKVCARTYVISMTHAVSDVLEVLVLLKEADLLRIEGDRIACDIEIAPLFETIDDLHSAKELMRVLFANQVYREVVKAQGNRQEVMLGYSDSSKDGGYLAANWALFRCVCDLRDLGAELGVEIDFFHGRGGTVGRGGGRANRAIQSQPSGSYHGPIRFTEQGEVISFRYSLPAIAHRHLEQIVGACIHAYLETGRRAPKEFFEAMRFLDEVSRKAYRDLVYGTAGFWAYYCSATPIEHISLLPIASRPVHRPGKEEGGIASLRAIPWNFAWVQNRTLLVGWYGLGAAFRAFEEADPANLDLMRRMYQGFPFFRTMVDNAQLELGRADLQTGDLYAEGLQEGKEIQQRIRDEFERTVAAVLAVTGERELLENSAVLRRTIEFRNPVTLPLNRMQIHLMRQWKDLSADEREGPWREAMLQSIAGIAAAMQSTG